MTGLPMELAPTSECVNMVAVGDAQVIEITGVWYSTRFA
jgi:hypothetical protein